MALSMQTLWWNAIKSPSTENTLAFAFHHVDKTEEPSCVEAERH